MRNLEKELSKLIEFANANDNIRALVLQGSYVNDNVILDDFSDLDPLFYVRDLSAFIEHNEWKSYFGNPISFFHDEGDLQNNLKWYTRLTIYSDGFKMDFGFQHIDSAKYANDMSLYKIVLDKDGIIPTSDVNDERKFYVKKPTEEEFLERINTFFFDTSYVIKSLIRDEMFFEKFMEIELQRKIHKLLEWHIGTKHDFSVNTGLLGRYFKRYLTSEEWNMLLKTYSGSNKEDCIKALFSSFDLVNYLGNEIASKLGFTYPKQHENDMREYCEKYAKSYLNIEVI